MRRSWELNFILGYVIGLIMILIILISTGYYNNVVIRINDNNKTIEQESFKIENPQDINSYEIFMELEDGTVYKLVPVEQEE